MVVAGAATDLDGPSLKALMDGLISVGDTTLDSLVANDPPQGTLACGEGCTHCCRVQVQASAIEILHITQMLVDVLGHEPATRPPTSLT